MRNLCIITGATSGIGLELAKIYSCFNIDLLLISSNINNLEKTKKLLDNNGANIDILEMNLINGIDLEKLKEKTDNKSLYCLINNAGFGDLGDFVDSNLKKAQDMIDLNIKALTSLSYFFLKKNKDTTTKSYLLNVGSVASFMCGPKMAVYYATKAYVLSFTNAIRRENSNKFIKISCLCPGPTKTNFTKNFKFTPNVFKNIFAMKSYDVALCAYYGLLKGKKVIIPGVTNYLMIKVIKFIPSSLVEVITKKIMG